MTNHDSGEHLLQDAVVYYEEMQRMFEREKWNIVVRRAQEVVELSLKGILKIMGIDFPKVHNVAPLFVNLLQEKGIELGEEVSERILSISTLLAKDRAPAFYGEKVYLREDAETAQNGAKEIVERINEIRKKLDKK
jgi:HEPN domain-containing protein